MKRILAAAALILAAAPAAAQQGGAPERSILEVADGLYRFQDNSHFGVFLVTDEGILVADPLNRDAATWLKGELESRFDLPVEYVLYTHHHADHASGAAVFEGAEVLAHAFTTLSLARPTEGTPEYDRFMAQFGPDSPYGGVEPPNSVFSGAEHTVSLGDTRVKMVHVGGAHAPDMSVIVFPEQETLFVADIVSGRRLGFSNLPGFDPADQQAMVQAVLAQDFAIMVPGHGDIGGRSDVEDYGQYFRDLVAGVQAGIDTGRSLEEIQATLLLEDYADWGAYDLWRESNIEGAYRALTAD